MNLFGNPVVFHPFRHCCPPMIGQIWHEHVHHRFRQFHLQHHHSSIVQISVSMVVQIITVINIVRNRLLSNPTIIHLINRIVHNLRQRTFKEILASLKKTMNIDGQILFLLKIEKQCIKRNENQVGVFSESFEIIHRHFQINSYLFFKYDQSNENFLSVILDPILQIYGFE